MLTLTTDRQTNRQTHRSLDPGIQISQRDPSTIYAIFLILYTSICIKMCCCHLNRSTEQWLSSWLAEQEVRGSIAGLVATISEIGYLLLPCRDMAERSLKRR